MKTITAVKINAILGRLSATAVGKDSFLKLLDLKDEVTEISTKRQSHTETLMKEYGVVADAETGNYSWIGNEKEKEISEKVEALNNKEVKVTVGFLKADEFFKLTKELPIEYIQDLRVLVTK